MCIVAVMRDFPTNDRCTLCSVEISVLFLFAFVDT